MIDKIFKGQDSPDVLRRPKNSAQRQLGGKAFNIAVAAAKLGCDVHLVSAIGGDDDGVFAREAICELGVNDKFVVTCSWARTPVPTPRALLTEGRFGERQVEVEQDHRIEHCYEAACDNFRPDAVQPHVIIFTLEFPDQVLKHVASAIRRCKRMGKPLVVGNPSPRRTEMPSPSVGELLRLTDGLTPNRYEAEYLIGGQDRVPKLSTTTPRRVTEIYRAKWCVTTYGVDGWSWCDTESKTGWGKVASTRVHDKVGASDVFTAMLSLMRLWGAPVETASFAAGVAARIAVGRRGGAERFPTIDDVLSELKSTGTKMANSAIDIVTSKRVI